MKFTKMHGIGNDYVYINGYETEVQNPESLAPKIADRHYGVGGDGLIMILPPEEGIEADVRMRMFNADGSESEMCGNGIRCVAKYAHDHLITDANPMQVQTGAGVLEIDFEEDDEGKLTIATVNMGEPILLPSDIPVSLSGGARVAGISGENGKSPIVDAPLNVLDITWPNGMAWTQACGLEPGITCVSMGNPHVMLYVKDVEQVPLEIVGPYLEKHPMFPNRINVHFVQIHNQNELTMRTWERGTGITLACGTGASAVCVAGVLTERNDRQTLIHLPGGDLNLRWDEVSNHVFMSGAAEEVYTGEWPE